MDFDDDDDQQQQQQQQTINQAPQMSDGAGTHHVHADGSFHAEAEDNGTFGTCVGKYCKNLQEYVMERLGWESNKDIVLTQSTFTTMMEQSKHICRDHIYRRLAPKDMTAKLAFGGYNTVLSESYLTACQVLETYHPTVYTDVSRKIGRTMSTPGIVKATLNDVLDIMFRDTVTWGKVVSMFAIASAFAEECVQQGHPGYVNDVVNTVGGFVALHLVEWLTRHGGWKGLDQAFRETKRGFDPSVYIGVMILMGVFVGFIAIALTLLVGRR